MPDVHQTIQNWQNIHNAGLALNVIQFTTPAYDYSNKGEPGTWLYLEGFTVTLDGDTHTAHITITKKPTKEPAGASWTYCHLTVDRKGKNHVFYEVDDAGGARVTQTLLDFDGKQKNGKAHYKNDQINDAGLRAEIQRDLDLVFAYLA
ncbi:hypothetical protein ACGF0J_32495 [Nonomuraea sp. NPDC047897]|uniref:hypothetical protein n=1 Tax=Nonomuraea sp. NPDC047897 TaxID=3364346 RepID=UPI00371D5618